MDYQRPEPGGFEATRLTRGHAHSSTRVPIEAMMAKVRIGGRGHDRETGREEHVSKPVQLDGLNPVFDRSHMHSHIIERVGLVGGLTA